MAESKNNTNIFAYISFFVAALSLVATMYQAYLNTRYVELIQTSVQRAETARICKDLIDAFFQVKFRTGLLASAFDREKNPNAAPVLATSGEALNAVSRFGAYGTYLANFQGDARRAEYSALTSELLRVVELAQRSAVGDPPKLFEKADVLFERMNADCVRSATSRL